MERPVILAVDDESAVLAAVARDLRRRYGDRYRIVSSDSGQTALDVVRQLKLREEPIALFLVDQRMPQMTGVEFLLQASEVFPDAKRALLTAYADTDVAIKAINDVRLDHYLMKPWDPPEEQLYPILDDLLDDWQASFHPPFEGIRIIGNRWSPVTFTLKDFLARNMVPYRWLDIETQEGRDLATQTGLDINRLPVVIFQDGTHLIQPTLSDVIQKIGLQTHATLPFYDLVIVGAGPAGLAAAVYGASEGLRTLMIEREAPGGQAGTSSRIENYLGFPAGLSGSDLARRAVAQARRLGAEILAGEVDDVRVDGQYRIVRLKDGSEINCHALLVATGVSYRRLSVPGADRLTGAGIYYGGALTEAMASKGEDVFIVGGANSAGQAAMYFSKYSRTVTMLVRSDSLSKDMSQYLIDQIEATENIRVWPRTEVVEAHGDQHLEAITIEHKDSGETEKLPATAIFVFIGAQPYTEWISDSVAVDRAKFILTGPDLSEEPSFPSKWPLERLPYFLETSVPGIFVAGDVRHQSMRRIASATGEGAMAVHFIHRYLATL